MPRCAFLTTEDLEEFVVYDELTYPHFEALGWSVEAVPWRAGLDTDYDWGRFEGVILRSPWDYQAEASSFLEVLARIDGATRLENPLEVVRWNVSKSYLRELDGWGVPIVPTLFRAAGAPIEASFFEALGGETIVVKPLVSGNADHTYVLDRDGLDRDGLDRDGLDRDALERGGRVSDDLSQVFAERAYLVQPFMPAIVEEGEYSLFYFDGEYSHAILKTPKAGDFRVQEEHGGRIVAVDADGELRRAAERALDAAPGGPLLYARVDLVRDADAAADARWRLMELELIEPSLYFPYAPGSAERFAAAAVRRLGG